MQVHKIQNNNQTSFKKIIYDDAFTEQITKKDFKDPELNKIYNKLVESQKNNPINIIMSLFPIDKNEIPMDDERWNNWYWYLKAKVGKRVFEQKTTSHSTDYKPSITFLKRACLYADFLNIKSNIFKFLKLGK